MTIRFFVRSLMLAGALLLSSAAYAATPSMSLSVTDGDSVQVRVTGDASTQMTLNYTNSSGAETLRLGTSDSGGYLSTIVNTADNGIVPGTPVYVSESTGAHSGTVIWPIPTDSELSLPYQTVALPVGESTSIQANDPDGIPLVLQDNSNTAAVSASVGAGQISLRGNQAGSATVTVCFAGFPSDCEPITVTVGSQSGATSLFDFSQTNPVVVAGQSTTVFINGVSQSLYVGSNANPSVAQVNIQNNAINIIGNTAGATTISICTSASQCGTMLATVIPSNGSTVPGPVVSQSAVSLTAGQTRTLLIAGNGNYTVSSNNPNIASTTLMYGTNLVVSAISAGSATVSACDSSSLCASVSVSVAAGSVPAVSTTIVVPSPPVATAPSATLFTSYLTPGAQGSEVTALQQVLAAQGYFSGTATGYYGTVTENAVIALQAAHGLSQLGVVGPATRALLNSLGTSPASATTGAAASGGYVFSNFLSTGSTGADVTALQNKLTALGIYAGPVTGYFGSLTAAAVASFQSAHGIASVGYVGPATRAALNGN